MVPVPGGLAARGGAARALAGELERARETFERAVAASNDVGLLAEEVDPRNDQMIGNYPQAFSHIGLINAAWAITQAEERRAAGQAAADRPKDPATAAATRSRTDSSM